MCIAPFRFTELRTTARFTTRFLPTVNTYTTTTTFFTGLSVYIMYTNSSTITLSACVFFSIMNTYRATSTIFTARTSFFVFAYWSAVTIYTMLLKSTMNTNRTTITLSANSSFLFMNTYWSAVTLFTTRTSLIMFTYGSSATIPTIRLCFPMNTLRRRHLVIYLPYISRPSCQFLGKNKEGLKAGAAGIAPPALNYN